MARAMRAMRALLIVLACACLPHLGDAVAAQAPGPTAARTAPIGPCSILTVVEVSSALGEPVTVVEDTPDTCVFAAETGAGSLSGLAASREHVDPLAAEPLVDQLRATFPSAEDVVIAGFPGLATASEGLASDWAQAQLVLFPDPATVLFLTVVVAEDDDAAAVLRDLAELAAPRLAGSSR